MKHLCLNWDWELLEKDGYQGIDLGAWHISIDRSDSRTASCHGLLLPWSISVYGLEEAPIRGQIAGEHRYETAQGAAFAAEITWLRKIVADIEEANAKTKHRESLLNWIEESSRIYYDLAITKAREAGKNEVADALLEISPFWSDPFNNAEVIP